MCEEIKKLCPFCMCQEGFIPYCDKDCALYIEEFDECAIKVLAKALIHKILEDSINSKYDLNP